MQTISCSSVAGSLMFAQGIYTTWYCLRYWCIWEKPEWSWFGSLESFKNVLRFFQGNEDHGLTYRQSDILAIIGYFDANFASCSDGRKCTSNYVFMIEGRSWFLEKCQTPTTSSTIEAKYLAYYEPTRQAIWLRNLTSGLGVNECVKHVYSKQGILYLLRHLGQSRAWH